MRGPRVRVSGTFRSDVSRATRDALALRAREGRPTGGRAYGYNCADGRRSINDEQADVVRFVFKRWIEGASCRAIAEELNSRGVAPSSSTWKGTKRRSDTWGASSINVMVTNPLYTGIVNWNASKRVVSRATGRVRQVPLPKGELFVRHDEKLRIVSDETFEAAQVRRNPQAWDERQRLSRGPWTQYDMTSPCPVVVRHGSLHSAWHSACSNSTPRDAWLCWKHARVLAAFYDLRSTTTDVITCKACNVRYAKTHPGQGVCDTCQQEFQHDLNIGCLYVIAAPSRVKIGRSYDARRRFQGLRTASPVPLKLVYETPLLWCSALAERTVHAVLSEHREHGEWFNVQADDAVQMIQKLLEQNPHWKKSA